MSADPKPEASRALVADTIAETLAAYGAEFAFGIPGNDVLEIVRACEANGIEFVLAKSEPAAGFMADAVYQLTGNPTVLIPAMGPGMANAMAAIGGALMERSAMLVLTGDVGGDEAGIYNHQVFDHAELARPLVKHVDQLNPHRAAQQTARALDIATTYPAGPAMLNCPADFSGTEASQPAIYTPPSRAAVQLDQAAAHEIKALLGHATRPLAVLGRGALAGGVPVPLARCLETWDIPFLQSYKAKGVVDEAHPLSLGAVGLSPIIDGENFKLLEEADLVLLIGYDPIELRNAWVDAWPEDKTTVTIDWGPQTHRVFPVGREAHGDLPLVLGQLGDGPGSKNDWPSERLDELRRTVDHIVRPRTPDGAVSPAALFKNVSDRLTEDWILTVDVGAHRILANHAIKCRTPGQLIQSNGLCCMGYAIPAAIGAGLAAPEKSIVALVGDGCTLMTIGELAVAAERDMPLVVVVINDAALALIKLKQNKMQMDRRAVDFGSPRYDLIAQGFGAAGVRVDSIEAFSAALDEAIESRKLTVIDTLIDPSEYWEQM